MLNADMLPRRWRQWRAQVTTIHLLPAIPVLIVVLVFLPVLGSRFVWDDDIFLSDLLVYRAPTPALVGLLRPFVLSPNYFRPLVVLTFLVELRLWPESPGMFHLSNLLLHACNTLLVTLLARWLWPIDGANALPPYGRWLPLIAGLLYGLHPALIESVAFVSSRFDLLMTTCLLLALLFDLRLRGRLVTRALLVGLLLLLALLAKEMAAAFVLVLPVWHQAVGEPGRGRK